MSDSSPSRRTKLGSLAIPIVLLLLIGAAAWWYVDDYRPHQRAENERHASTAIKTLSLANRRFRDGAREFWTGDVAGLFQGGLIERELAEADAKPLTPLCPKPVPYHGYYFMALEGDASESYRRDGKPRHPEKYGFIAYPADPGEGKYYYMINESTQVIRASLHFFPLPKCFPSDDEFRNYWTKPE
jgi:hypothetical protein